jgi:RNA polymerase sigma factor (sigma-70 family)
VANEDSSLVRRCLKGDPEAVRALVERFQPLVFGLCFRLLQDRHDAEDVSQEVFLRVFRSLKGWDATRPLKPWIMGITVNCSRTWAAQRNKQPDAAPYLQDTAPSRPEDDSVELVSEIQAALAGMRLDYRTVFVMFHEHGEPCEEIAKVLGKPVGTVKTWLRRARMEVLDHLRRRGIVH